ncbi:hypothetical protein LSH36_343g01029 [Paralvinella palmiformis]|uniref:Uncharacterized protein n=1 Tax=Paralvinella palmiformis TaxID=53620 RepID=A0AAD9JGH4_9ANNE|nr:hypothetical protein LSH36_343g01029 [Paralvinella palmiformis]
MGVSARTEHILLTSLVFGLLSSLIIGLTIGLRTPPLPNGGSPTDPPLSNDTTTRTNTEITTTTPKTTTTTKTATTITTTTVTSSSSTITTTTDEVTTAETTTAKVTTATNTKTTSASDSTTNRPAISTEEATITSSLSSSTSSKLLVLNDVHIPKLDHFSEHGIKKWWYLARKDNLVNKVKDQHSTKTGSKLWQRHVGNQFSGKSEQGKRHQKAISREHHPIVADDTVPWDPSVNKSFRHAAVTTDTIPCSTIGTDMLRAGGSAVDAAIAATICVGIVNHHSSGIGGGHFMTIYETPRDGDIKELRTIQAREWAPLASSRDMFVNNTDASTKGGLSIAVPGEVKGFYAAWQRYGRLPWSDLFQPSIRLCEEGFIVEGSLSGAIQSYEDDIRKDPNLSELFVKENGSLITEGDLLKNPKLGATLARIAEDPDTFYSGSLADDIIADLTEYGSIITKEDLRGYRAKLKMPSAIHLSNGNLSVYSVTPPSSGVVYQYILNILNGYNFEPGMLSTPDNEILAHHRIIEAFKFAYAKRSNLGDEEFVDVKNLVVNLTSPEYGEYIRTRINDNTTENYTYYEPDFDMFVDGGTAHMSVLAPDGAAVAVTMTINLFFGSNVRGNRTGILFNDAMDDFSTPGTENSFGVPSSPANYIVPGKMPMSSMCPSIVIDNNTTVVFISGGSGGTRIMTGTAFVTIQSIWFEKSLIDATDTARVHHQLIPEDVKHEPHLSQDIIDGLTAKNHVVLPYGNIATVNSISNTCNSGDDSDMDACIHAVSDGRKGGSPDGI